MIPVYNGFPLPQVKNFLLKSAWVRRRVRDYYTRNGHVDWERVLGDEPYEAMVGGGAKVLIATGVGCNLPAMTMEGLLSLALAMRKGMPSFLLCDHALPACMACQDNWHAGHRYSSPLTDRYCKACFAPAAHAYSSLGFPLLRYGENLGERDREDALEFASKTPEADIRSCIFEGVHVGEHAYAGALRFFARGDLNDVPHAESVLRDYLQAAVLTARMARRVLEKQAFDVVVLHHGIYVPQGIWGEVCRLLGVRTVNWTPSYKKGTFIFSHEDTYHRAMISEPVDTWQDLIWDHSKEEMLDSYLHGRRYGKDDWIWFHGTPSFDLKAAVEEHGINPDMPTTGLLTSVVWDASIHYKSMAFPNMVAWLVETVKYFAKRPDRQLVIRVHPAEITGSIPSRQRVKDELQRAFDRLPSNVVLIPPEKDISTYSLMGLCDQVLIYNTKAGIEMAAQGVPVLVAGDAWIRGKGFAWEASSKDEYLAELGKILDVKKLDEERLLLAKKYAYHFFFRRMIEINLFKATNCIRQYEPRVESLEELRPGADKGLDVVCNGILDGMPFVGVD